jgi:hypothetical protein
MDPITFTRNPSSDLRPRPPARRGGPRPPGKAPRRQNRSRASARCGTCQTGYSAGYVVPRESGPLRPWSGGSPNVVAKDSLLPAPPTNCCCLNGGEKVYSRTTAGPERGAPARIWHPCKDNRVLELPRARGGKEFLMAKKTQGPPRRILRGQRLSSRGAGQQARRCCGLCGATENLTKTDCCGQWICDDEDQYVVFSYAHNSCSRNHRRYTLCGHHSEAGHEGTWQDCLKCRAEFVTEMYVYRGTNEYNFEKLTDPPAFEPTLCAGCGKRINLSEGGWSFKDSKYTCMDCLSPAIQALLSRK